MGHEMKQILSTFYIAMAAAGTTTAQTPITATATELSGKVTDGVQHTAIRGAVIKIAKADGTKVSETQTEADGTYKATGLAPQPYHVTYSKDDVYEPEFRDVPPTIGVDVELTQWIAGDVYWRKESDNIKVLVLRQPEAKQHEVFARSWQNLRLSGVSAEGKARTAHHLKASLPEAVWSDSSGFEIYAAADPVALNRAEHAMYTNPGDPTALTLHPLIRQDITLSQEKLQKSGFPVKDYQQMYIRQEELKKDDPGDSSNKLPIAKPTVVDRGKMGTAAASPKRPNP
jgi:Carboxypeptidase regulatory-like domain